MSRERNQSLVKRKKAASSDLSCEVCGFNFDNVYGKTGEGYIECRHVVPLAELEPGAKTRLKDLALVCANCDRVLHRQRPWPPIDQLRVLVSVSSHPH